jgi:Rrf2 family iron-sulfur cluster assembly transcriptional regulator
MLSNTSKYGIRAVIYIASREAENSKTGLIQISKDLKLPSPFLAKILQQLAKQKILISLKGPHGGFSLQRKPEKISLYDIVTTIDGDGMFTDCIIHNTKCGDVENKHKECPVHHDFAEIRKKLIQYFKKTTIADLVEKARDLDRVVI